VDNDDRHGHDPRHMLGAPGRLFVWGGPRFGRVPKEVFGLDPVSVAAVSDDLCVAIAQDGNVYAVQPPPRHGAEPKTGELSPEIALVSNAARGPQVTALDTSIGRAVDVAIRGDTSEIVVADSSGYVSVVAQYMAKGANAATPENDVALFSPGRVLGGALKRAHVTRVRCGSRHCVAIDAHGAAYSWGNNSFQQLARGSADASAGVVASSRAGTSAKMLANDDEEPARIPVPAGARIVDAACGGRHTVLLGDDGTVYAAGDGRWAQLGITAEPWLAGAAGPVADARPAECIADLAVRELACGDGHTLTLVKDGTVFSFGANDFGQLGHHNMSSFAPPSPIANVSLRAVAVRSGRNHSCMVTDLGEVYCIGNGDAGQLGSGPLQRSAVWRRVKKLGQLSNGGIVANLAAGGDTTAAVVVNATGSNT
jgi:hypothetical protein